MTRTTLAATAAAALAAMIPYLTVTGDYFLQDDFGVVALLSQKPWSYFPRWFVSTWMDDIWGFTPDEIRPFPALSYQVGALWGAGSPVANHVINILFHALNTMLVYAIGRDAAGLRPIAALAAAIVFAWLPMQAETVVWITGRVDSLPAFFYLAAFLLFVRWRSTHSRWAYAGSIVCAFIALFSKQNTVTLPAALLAYDVLVLRRWPRSPWRGVVPYLPFVALTAAYLWLRWLLFGQVAREGMLTADALSSAFNGLAMHVMRMVYGEPGLSMTRLEVGVTIAAAAAVVAALAYRYTERRTVMRLSVSAVYFGVVWMVLGLAPTLVAGYVSPRHAYLASVGWALAVGIGAEALSLGRSAWVPWVGRAATGALLVAYAMQLPEVVRGWHARAAISEAAVRQIEQESRDAPDGTLILAGVPASSWAFAVPHALRPPFTNADVTERSPVVTHSSLYCCPADQWDRHTRALLREWQTRAPQRVVALSWDPRTGRMSRLTDRESEELGFAVRSLAETEDRATMDSTILRILTELVAPHRTGESGGGAGTRGLWR